MKKHDAKQEWLLFFYSVPSKPVSNRMKIWRMLVKSGAVQFKGAAYILPSSDDHYELFQWLVTSVTSMKGEAAFVNVSNMETMKQAEIISLFDQQRERDYQELGERLDDFENRVRSIRKRVSSIDNKKIKDELNKFLKEFQEIVRIDFFSSRGRKDMEMRLSTVAAEITGMTREEPHLQEIKVKKRRAADYQGKVWVTRKKPFIDRFASAWLIREFIDKKATFGFIDESEIESLNKDWVAYDMVGGEFTHVGNSCTFEVLVKSFGLKGKAIGRVAEIVHQLDLNDELYKHPVAEGLVAILDGIRKTVTDDHEALAKGMSVFEMLYASSK